MLIPKNLTPIVKPANRNNNPNSDHRPFTTVAKKAIGITPKPTIAIPMIKATSPHKSKVKITPEKHNINP